MNDAQEMPMEGAKWVAGAVCGALAMYLLDPEKGVERRARLAVRMRTAGNRAGSMLGHLLNDLGNGMSRVGGPLGLYGMFKPRSPLGTLLGLAGLLMAARSSETGRIVTTTASEEKPAEAIRDHEAQIRRIDQRLH